MGVLFEEKILFFSYFFSFLGTGLIADWGCLYPSFGISFRIVTLPNTRSITQNKISSICSHTTDLVYCFVGIGSFVFIFYWYRSLLLIRCISIIHSMCVPPCPFARCIDLSICVFIFPSCLGQVTRIALLWTLASWATQQPWPTTSICFRPRIEAPLFLTVGWPTPLL